MWISFEVHFFLFSHKDEQFYAWHFDLEAKEEEEEKNLRETFIDILSHSETTVCVCAYFAFSLGFFYDEHIQLFSVSIQLSIV